MEPTVGSKISSSDLYHCAYCLKEIPQGEEKKCGKCHRRSYCSKDCQVADWTTKFPLDASNQRGQGHKNWCGIDSGEEDLDWKMAPVEGKGLGIIALRDIPARSRIMVDACQLLPEAHPQIKTLMPAGGSLIDKFRLNALGIDEGDVDGSFDQVLCLRISRVNHSCSPNADHVYIKQFGVKVLFSERNIMEGEEITINYTVWNDISKDKSIQTMSHLKLGFKWGIQCPTDCRVNDPEIMALIQRSRELDEMIATSASTGHPERAMRGVKQLMTNYDAFGGALMNRKRTLYDGFQIGILKRNTVKDGITFLGQLLDLISGILHPADDYIRQVGGWLKDPSTHRNYCRL